MAGKEYDAFISRLEDLPQEGEVNLAVRDLTPGPRKYDSRYVRAHISRDQHRLPGADTLWLRFPKGQKHPQPWAIRILEELAAYNAKPPETVG